jgi:uncharacterized protein
MEHSLKLEQLKKIIIEYKDVVVLFSGGVDSTFLLKICKDTLGNGHCLPVIVSSPLYPERELTEAENLARFIGTAAIIINASYMEDERFTKNERDRCYHCKLHISKIAREIAKGKGYAHIIEGSHLDDTLDFRPGLKACREMGIKSPLIESGLTKREVREISKALGLPTHDRPSNACLASRIPYGIPIEPFILRMVNDAEKFLKDMGFSLCRVRYHGSIARIEVQDGEIERIIKMKNEIVEALKGYGFAYVTIDLGGYRTGSMNEAKANMISVPKDNISRDS